MRDFKGMKRQRGRNRSGGKPQQHNANRAFDSNGPEGIKVRGAAQSVFDKYQQLARDASTAGDRVLAENYLQHAEHYFRLIRAVQPNRPVAEIVGRDSYTSGFDIDFEAEHEDPPEQPAEAEAPAEGGETEERPRFEGRRDRERFNRDRDDRPRDDRQRDDRPRDERPREDRQDRNRDDRQRDDRPRDDRPRDQQARGDQQPREEREGGRRDRWRERDERRERFDRERAERERGEARDPLAVIEPQAAAPLAPEAPSEGSPRLRGQDGAVSELPGFLSRPAEPREEAAGDEPARKPRRRRAPKSFEGGDAPSESEDA